MDFFTPILRALAHADVCFVVVGGIAVVLQGHVASIPDLIRLKRRSGRPQDLADIEELEKLQELRGDSE